jgi:hypothetical protein
VARGTAEGRRSHLEAIGRILSLYRRRVDNLAVMADAGDLDEAGVEAVELRVPGATEEG